MKRKVSKRYIYLLLLLLIVLGIGIKLLEFHATSKGYLIGGLTGIKAYKFPSGSMLPTLMIGDHVIVYITYYENNKVKRGDIIVFKYPVNPRKDFLKRVIAIGGDVIESKDKTIYINGNEINEPYIQHADKSILPKNIGPRDNFGPIEIPKDNFFVMGDNRDESHDSRFWGFVDIKDIKGKARYIYWSWDRVSKSVRWNRIGKKIE